MARPTKCCATTSTLKIAATLILVFTLTFPLIPMSVGSNHQSRISDHDDEYQRENYGTTAVVLDEHEAVELMRKKVQLGSRPPGCLNKCMNCRPCQATLVIPPHDRSSNSQTSHREDDTYYLLLWKCRCGDKLFQP